MRVCVVYASKHEATAGIAQAIARTLRERGFDVDVADARSAPAPEPYDALVIGSAVYVGQWRKEAVAYLRVYAEVLRGKPTWLFSSGPLGHDDPQPREASPQGAEFHALVRAREHTVFAGALHRAGLGWVDRAVVGALKAPEGDFRDWDAVRAWSQAIADALDAGPTDVAETATAQASDTTSRSS